jgi:hypothetical protein
MRFVCRLVPGCEEECISLILLVDTLSRKRVEFHPCFAALDDEQKIMDVSVHVHQKQPFGGPLCHIYEHFYDNVCREASIP